ncbi:hypothetical protein Hypma_013057 [Hypsizygus marmoreus]|uniref:F-box domain-containing protein n=1 Tax=Hypsizygus marmoreus TaxID=39966 RepID=A0A369JMH2_HYPMA|nr:hypothetical protein Hypma_013057 [Hypsizygus marmoreus]
MHHALVISDILSSIFKFTDTDTDISCARVCRAWQENALDVLWYRVDRLERLFSLLGPMGEVGPQLITFIQYHISSDRWDRFSFYANRVRRLECTDTSPDIHYQSFSTVSISRPVLHLVPNLTHLTWRKDPARPAASLVLCLLFLSPELESLSVETGGPSYTEGDLFAIGNFFEDVLRRSPRIQHLEFRTDIPFHDMGPALSNFLGSLYELRSVLLSHALLSSDVVTALAKCPLLEAVRMTDPYATTEVQEDAGDLQNFMPVMEHGAFPSIREMHINAHLWNVLLFLRSEFPTTRIRRLLVKTLSPEINESIAQFFALVAETCPEIEELGLSVQYGAADEDAESLLFPALEPLLSCASLKMLTLCLALPLEIDDTEAAQMASHWPLLQNLNLNPAPAILRSADKHLTFAALMSFAQYCPDLRNLSIYIQSSIIPELGARKLLPNLETLVLGLIGTSYSIEELALFLTDVTPPTCLLSGTPYITSELRVHTHVAQLKLDKVFALLPMLRSIHAQYRERLRTLEADVERLTLAATSATNV